MSIGSAWGPSAWKFLHTITFAYPDNPTLEEQQSAESFFRSLGPLLPCASCREHYVNEIFLRPPEVSSKTALSSWLVEVHNRVNYRLGKPIMSNFEAKRLYESASQCSANCGGSPTQFSRNNSSVVTATKEKTEIKKDLGTAAAVSLLTLLILFALGSAFGFYVFKSWKKSNKNITNIKN